MRVQWPAIFTGERQFVTDTVPPALDPVHFVAAEGELLISYASIFRMALEHASKTYQIYGFGNMLTFPSFREKGFGGRVLNLATDYIKQGDVVSPFFFATQNANVSMQNTDGKSRNLQPMLAFRASLRTMT